MGAFPFFVARLNALFGWILVCVLLAVILLERTASLLRLRFTQLSTGGCGPVVAGFQFLFEPSLPQLLHALRIGRMEKRNYSKYASGVEEVELPEERPCGSQTSEEEEKKKKKNRSVAEHPRWRLLDQGGQGRTEEPIIYTAAAVAAAHLTLTVPSFTRKGADGVVVVRAGGVSAAAAAYCTPFPSFFGFEREGKYPRLRLWMGPNDQQHKCVLHGPIHINLMRFRTRVNFELFLLSSAHHIYGPESNNCGYRAPNNF
ncbi:hypothetical protein DAPPUDRAFT_236707 [Daphnia pulex]|uniref:Uncharacterized protein n=1 Tax=Daphnia pulex TaxID=6669 RepID=E9G2X6_DAPPU|nr:hypothetical protein DAPPUDRAFT_236707 [Daphnia pulex]|eukprot:EFX86118.1 hypothetical protein DAPPUDRAFT_236707 [Daphnia pulex]